MDLRPQNGANFLLSGHKLKFEDVLSGKESTHMLLADRVLPDLITAAKESGNPIAQQAAATLTGMGPQRRRHEQRRGVVRGMVGPRLQ